MNINLHIARLTLEGVNISPNQQHMLRSALVTELNRLLHDNGISPALNQNIDISRITAGKLQLFNNNPKQLGHRIAQSVHKGISHE